MECSHGQEGGSTTSRGLTPKMFLNMTFYAVIMIRINTQNYVVLKYENIVLVFSLICLKTFSKQLDKRLVLNNLITV